MCRTTKTQLGVREIAADDPWKSQPWPAVVEAEDCWSRFPLSKADQFTQQGFHILNTVNIITVDHDGSLN